MLVLAIAVGLGLYFGLHHSSTNKGKAKTSFFGPIGYSAAHLKTESSFIHTKFYWAGPQQGDTYEFTRTSLGYLFVRYLPGGVQVGAPGANFLIVSTYPIHGAYEALQAEGEEPGDPRAEWKHHLRRSQAPEERLHGLAQRNDQVEVYDPRPAVAFSTARSGKIKPVR